MQGSEKNIMNELIVIDAYKTNQYLKHIAELLH